jgi:acyl-CoA thioester hydrolase
VSHAYPCHVYHCHVRFSDVDVYGHVNNVKYFEYYQEARLAYLASFGRQGEDDRFTIVLATMKVDYKRPILFRPEPYEIETRVSRVGNSSFGLSSEIRDGELLLSRADAVMVTFDARSQSARPLSDLERELLVRQLEG